VGIKVITSCKGENEIAEKAYNKEKARGGGLGCPDIQFVVKKRQFFIFHEKCHYKATKVMILSEKHNFFSLPVYGMRHILASNLF